MTTRAPTKLVFHTSSYSDRNNCVEVATLPNGAAIRDSKHPNHGHLLIPHTEWVAFLAATARHEL